MGDLTKKLRRYSSPGAIVPVNMATTHELRVLCEKAAVEIERLRSIEVAARAVADTLNGGFIACACGRQEATTDIDFADTLYEALGITAKE